MVTCIRPNLAPSTCYRFHKCRCTRCQAWKHDIDARPYNREQAKQRSRDWRTKNQTRSRLNSARYQKAHPEKLLQWQIKKYGLTLVAHKELVEKHDNQCAICTQPAGGMQHGHRLCIDHDPVTKKIRGLLCGSCNIGLGQFKHKIAVLQNAIAYLKENGDVY